jgi:hypothetical protein
VKDDGGQAFPQPLAIGPSDDMYPAYPGMTLRDWFAGQALAMMIPAYVNLPDSAELLARRSYAVADAMIEERTKK